MPEVIRFAKGTASEHLNFTGENGEITLICDDTPNRKVTGVIRLHDGQTVGGIPFGGSQLLNDLHDVNAANPIEFQVMTVDANGQFYFANTIQTEKLDVNGEITQPINTFIGSNIYYDGGWKYRGNGTGGILKLADGEGIVFSTTAYNVYGEGAAATPSEHMRINISGNVGIGTDNPQARLHISSETSGTVVTLSNQFGFSQFRQAANTLSISNADTLGSIVFETNNGAQRMRIDSSGALICLGSAVFNENGYVNDFRIESDTNTHAFYLDGATGNIGIGAGSPSATLHVDSQNTTAPSLTFGATSGQIFQNENSELAIGLSNSSPFPLYIQGRTNLNAARDIVINPLGGNCGIGTSSPIRKLTVSQAGTAEFVLQDTTRTVDGRNFRIYYGGGGLAFGTLNDAGTAGTDRMLIDSSGNVIINNLGTGTVYSNSGVLTNTNPSDLNLKENVVEVSYGLSEVRQLRPVEFDWIADEADKHELGFIAQEVQLIIPDLVNTYERIISEETGETEIGYGLESTQFIPVLVKAIQEQQTIIESQQSQIDLLTARIEALEAN